MLDLNQTHSRLLLASRGISVPEFIVYFKVRVAAKLRLAFPPITGY